MLSKSIEQLWKGEIALPRLWPLQPPGPHDETTIHRRFLSEIVQVSGQSMHATQCAQCAGRRSGIDGHVSQHLCRLCMEWAETCRHSSATAAL